MRLRFSIRALFILTTIVAALCLWFMLPSLTARRFVVSVAGEDFKSADELFRHADDRFLADWSDNRWSMRAYPELLPLTLSQCLRNERRIRVGITYFQFDQNMYCDVLITATPLGLKKPEFSTPQRTGVLYEERATRRQN